MHNSCRDRESIKKRATLNMVGNLVFIKEEFSCQAHCHSLHTIGARPQLNAYTAVALNLLKLWMNTVHSCGQKQAPLGPSHESCTQ